MNTFWGILIGIIAILLFYGFVYACLKASDSTLLLKNMKKREYVFLFLFFIISSIFVVFILSKNSFIYFWDCTMHWTPTISLSNDLFLDPIGTLKTIYNTTGITDYNWTMPLLYALPARIFGNSFEKVIFVVYIFYMCPAFIIISLCINKYLNLAGYKVNRVFQYVLMTFAFPIVLYVLLKGYLDPPILILSTCLLLLTADFEWNHFDFKRSILISFGILTMVLFRRHWAYWTIGFILSMCIEFVSQLKKNGKKQIKYFMANMLCIGTVCSGTLLLFFPEFLRRSLRNYYEIYAGWNNTFLKKILALDEACGNYIIIIFIGIGFVMWKNRQAIKYIVRMLVQMWVPTILMMSTVLMHDSHFYFEVVPILIMLAFIIEEGIKESKNKKFIVGLSYIYIGCNFLYCFYNPNNISALNDNVFHFVICDLRYQPYYRSDTESIHGLVEFLNEATEKYNTDCYICASSQNVNYHMLNLENAPTSQDSLQRDLAIASSDLRDGFSTNFFDAGIIVIEKNEDDEEIYRNYQAKGGVGVTKFLTEELLDRTGPVGKHYELIGEYELNYKYHSKAQVYLKISNYEESDYEYLMNYYDKLYPDHKDLFSERIKAYMEKDTEEIK